MKELLIVYVFSTMSSCSGNHFHDGKYQTNVFTDFSMSWVQKEQVELYGSDMYFKSISIIDKKTISEMRFDCEQFSDRIEFKDKNGVSRICRFDSIGNLKYGEYTYKKILK